MRQLDTQVFLASTLTQITSRFVCYSEEQNVKVTFPYFQKWHFWCQTSNYMTAFADQIYPHVSGNDQTPL